MREINRLLISELETRLLDQGINRIRQCLEKLSEEHIHFVPNTNSNSVNNQILHLDGNVRQWLIATFSNKEDNRKRNLEFDKQNRKSKSELIEILNELEKEVRSVFPNILSANITEQKVVQCYTETLFSIIVHVIEHFSYHLGQITYITKMLLDIDTGYYNDVNVDQINK